jgi:hypothetical protein
VDVRAAEARAREQRSSSTRRSRQKQRRGFDSSWSANSMASRASFQGSTTSSARRGVAKATDSDAATLMARRAGRRSGKAKAAVIARRTRKEQLRSGKAVRAEATRSGLDAQRKTGGGGRSTLMASQQVKKATELQNPEVRAESNRRVRECEWKCFASGRLGSIPQACAVQGNRPRASKLRASGMRAVQEQCAGDATGRGDPAGGYAGVPTVFLQHTRVSRVSSSREQENPEVRGGVSIANQSGPIGFFHESTTSSSSYSSPIVQARPTPQENP